MEILSIANRRVQVRYPLKLPVIFHWKDNDGTEHTGGGFTCDVALDGALIFSSRCPPMGTAIRIEVLIPAPDNGAEIRVECVGKVARVEDRAGCFGVRGIFDDDHITRQVMIWSHPGS
jgi:hypothetical protein